MLAYCYSLTHYVLFSLKSKYATGHNLYTSLFVQSKLIRYNALINLQTPVRARLEYFLYVEPNDHTGQWY